MRKLLKQAVFAVGLLAVVTGVGMPFVAFAGLPLVAAPVVGAVAMGVMSRWV